MYMYFIFNSLEVIWLVLLIDSTNLNLAEISAKMNKLAKFFMPSLLVAWIKIRLFSVSLLSSLNYLLKRLIPVLPNNYCKNNRLI